MQNSLFVHAYELRELFRMQNTGKNFETVDNPRPRPGKVGTTINQIDPSVPCGRQRIESGKFPKQLVLSPSTIDVASAKSEDNDFRSCLQYRLPLDFDRAVMLLA